MQGNVPNRWRIAAAGVAMQVALGAVYAWSVFRKPLSSEFDTSVSSVNLAFTVTIVFLGLSAYFGGLWMGKVGPRKVAMTAGLLYGAHTWTGPGCEESSMPIDHTFTDGWVWWAVIIFSSSLIARRRTDGSYDGPCGIGQLTRTPSISSRSS